MDDSGTKVGADEGQKNDTSGAEEESSATPAADDPSAFLRGPWELPLSYAVRIFDKVYRADIERLAALTVSCRKMG